MKSKAKQSRPATRFVVCVSNKRYSASLERRKIYQVLPDRSAERVGHLRVIDESGEDYLYPKALFASVSLPRSTKRAVLAA
jgi:hypothetical protein